jgi:autotransporter-associated beta strand protein
MVKFFKEIISKSKRPKKTGGDNRRIFLVTHSIHNKIIGRYQWYDRWHQHPHAHKVHYSALAVCLVSLVVGFGLLFCQPVQRTMQIRAESTTLVALDKSGVLAKADGETELISERTRNFKKFSTTEKTKDGKTVYRVAGDIAPIHYKLDDEDEAENYKEIDLTTVAGDGGADGDYKMTHSGFQMRVWNQRSDAKNAVYYIGRFERKGKWIEMAPLELYYENEKGEIQTISSAVGGITPTIDNNQYYIEWKDAFGAGIDFRYNLNQTSLFKTVVINDGKSLPVPKIDTTGLMIKLSMSMLWDDTVSAEDPTIGTYDTSTKSLVTDPVGAKTVESPEEKEITSDLSYKYDEKDIWWLKKPIAWDSAEEPRIFDLGYEFKQTETAILSTVALDYKNLAKIIYPFYIDASIDEEQIGAASDDAYQTVSTNNWNLTNSMPYLNSTSGNYYNGFRWTSVPIPNGATITSATFSPYMYRYGMDPQITIYGNDVDSASTFASSSDTFDLRAKTSASATWQAVDVNPTAGFYPSADFSSVVQEIVDRAGWVSNNDLAILTSSISGSYMCRLMANSSAYWAKLNISYLSAQTISGTVYSAEDKLSNIGSGKTIALSVDGGAKTTVETTGGGAFSFSDVWANENDAITIFVDDEDESANLISMASGADISGLEMYTDKVVLHHASAGPLTNTILDDADGSGDDDLAFSVSSGNSDFSDGFEVWIEAGKTYTPGGTVELDDLEVRGASGTFNPEANAVTVHGSWRVATDAVFTSTGTITYDNASGTETLYSGGTDVSHDFQNISKTGAGTLSLGYALSYEGSLTISAGSTLDLAGYNVSGDIDHTFSNEGTIRLEGGETCNGGMRYMDHLSGLVEYYGSGNYRSYCFNTTSSNKYYQVLISGSGSFDFSTTSRLLVARDSVTIDNGSIVGYFSVEGDFVQNGGTLSITTGTFRNFTQTSGSVVSATNVTLLGDFSIVNSWSGSSFTIDATDRDCDFDISQASSFSVNNLTFLNTSSVRDAVVTVGDGDVSGTNTLYLEADGSSNLTVDASGSTANFTFTHYNLNNGSGSGSEYLNLGNGTWERTAAENFSIGAGTILSAGNSKFIVSLGSGYVFNPNGNNLYDLIIKGPGHIGGALNISNNFTIDNNTASSASNSFLSGTGPHSISGDVIFTKSGGGDLLVRANDNTINVGGNLDFTPITFTKGTSTINLNGSGAQSFTSNSQSLNNLQVSNSSGEYVTFADGISLTGTFTATTAGSRIKFNAGSTYTIATLSMSGSAGNEIYLRSTSDGTQWNFNVSGASPTASYVNVKDSNASGGNQIDATTGGINSGNNLNWLFSTISISGSCDKYNRSDNCPDSETIKVALDGDLSSATGTTSSGSWSISGVDQPASGAVVTVFVDGVGDELEAVAVTKYDGTGNISGVALYERHLTIGSDDNQTISNSDLASYDNSVSSDEDIFYEVDSNNDLLLPQTGTSTSSDQFIYILGSNTYRPDTAGSGNISAPNLEIATSGILTADGNTITISGTGTPFVINGTFTSNTSTFKYTGTSATNITATTYYNLETSPASGTPTYTFASGTVTIEGNYTNGDGTNEVTTTADTNDPTININGNFTNSSSATFIASASASFSVASNFTNSATGTFTHSSGTLTLDGQGLQTITTAGDPFNNLTITNASAGGVTFADSTAVAGTATAVTPSTTLTFTGGTTHTWNTINLNGQALGTEITLQSSNTSDWLFVVTAQTAVSYVDVSHSDASGGIEIDASDGTNIDSDNNTYWNFGAGSVDPVNDSLTFTNVYSGLGNTAVADDTTEWNFEVKVTDADGPTNIDYVELRLANSSDSTQPYDSLKFRWTESTDTFSEQADTQDAATITSNSSDSSSSGNQWTLNFKIKFNNNFLAKDTNYAVELYTVDDSLGSDTDNYVDKYQVTALSLSINLDDDILEFGNLLPGSVITGTTVATVTTNYPNGYSLSVHDSVAGTDSALLRSGDTVRIADYAGTIALPTLWSDTGLGISLYSATGKSAKWGVGTTESDFNNKYAGVPQNATVIHEKIGSPTVNDNNNVGYKLVVPNTQKTGSYSGNIIYTVTGVLN